MCLVVYLGIDRELAGFSDPPVGEEGLDPGPSTRPNALAGKKIVYSVATRGDSVWCCSCVFIDNINPWELDRGYDPADPETAQREAAYECLRQIARAAVKVDDSPLIFSCWSGDESKEAAITRTLSPEELRPARYLFDDQLDGGQGGTPPILIRITKSKTEAMQ